MPGEVQTSGPSLILTEEANDAQRAALDAFIKVVPVVGEDGIAKGIELHDKYPSIALGFAEFIRYLRAYPDGDRVIEAWHGIVNTEAYKVADFDPDSEAALAEDPQHKALLSSVVDQRRESLRPALWRSRFGKFAGRLATHSDPKSTNTAA